MEADPTETMTSTLDGDLPADGGPLPFVAVGMNFGEPTGRRLKTDLIHPENTYLPTEHHQVRIHDARSIAGSLSLEEGGFILQRYEGQSAFDPDMIAANQSRRVGAPAINQAYWAENLSLIAKLSGSRDVFPMPGSLVVRRSSRVREKGWDPVVGLAHADFTGAVVGAFVGQALKDLGRTVPPYGRAVILQTWHAITPSPQDSLLAFVDGRTAKSSDFLVHDCFFGPGDTIVDKFESRIGCYSPEQRWYYFSNLQPDELLVFKGFDTATPDNNNVMHGAFDNPVADVLPRSSIEARYIALYD